MSWRFGSFMPHGMVLYLGFAGLLLALFGLWAEPRRHLATLLAVAGLLVYALGDWTPVYAWLIKLPVLGHLRAPVKAGELIPILLATPLALGWDRYARSPRRALPLAALAIALVLAVGGTALALLHERLMRAGDAYIQAKVLHSGIHHYPASYYSAKVARMLASVQPHLIAQAAFGALTALCLWWARRRSVAAGLALAVLLFAELASNGANYSAQTRPGYYQRLPDSAAFMREQRLSDPEPWRVLAWGWGEELRRVYPEGQAEGMEGLHQAFNEFPQGNQALIHGWEQFNGYSAAGLRRHEPLHGWFEDVAPGTDLSAQTAQLLQRRRLWDLGAVRYVVSSRELKAPDLRLARAGRPFIYENLRAAPMAYLARNVSGGWDQARAAAALGDPDKAARFGPRPALLEAQGSFGNAEGTLRWLKRDEHHWEVQADCPTGAGTAVFSMMRYPGLWKAFVDGAEAPLLAANAAFVAVAVPKGSHRVSLRLQAPTPAWARTAARAALWVCLALMLGAAWDARRSRMGHAS
jgi:hypothetical protein